MHRLALPAIVLAFATAMTLTSPSADTLDDVSGHYIIQSSSVIAFTVGQVGGGGFGGSFEEFTGVLDLDAQTPSRSSVSITLKPASIDARQVRINDFLRSSAVFDVRAYPVITFRSTRVSRTGPASARIDGVLTARGKAHDETFLASLTGHDARTVRFHISGRVLRSPYGMDVGTPIYSNVVAFEMDLQGRK